MINAGANSFMIFRRFFTLVGVGLIVFGVFRPFLEVPIFRDGTFIQITKQGAWIIFGLAAVSALCIFFKRFGLLYLTGLASIGLVIYTIYRVNVQKAGYISDFNKAMEGSPLKGLTVSFVKSVDFSHGAAIMLAGAVILVCVPLLGSRLRLRRRAGAESH